MYRPLSGILLRAPLLPVGALARARRALGAHPLGATAVEMASASLARAKAGAARDRAIDRYARRAAFRATPSGLLAGVCMGTLGQTTDLATGTPVAHFAPSWARLDALARALLDDPAVRARVRLRTAPSALRGAATVHWLGPGEPFSEERAADLDQPLTAILDATIGWTPWPEVGAHATSDGLDGDADGGDDLLLVLIDDGLLQTDLAPPLVGPAPGERLRDRLSAIGRTDDAEALEAALAALREGDLARGRRALASLPGQAERDVQPVLVHRPRKTPRLERAAVERAARLVPLLVRLQEALAPPAAERFASGTFNDALDASTEIFGAGAFDLGALAAGDYGVEIAGEGEAPISTPAPALLALLVGAVATAGRQKKIEAALDPQALAMALADQVDTPLPATAELFLAPVPRRSGRPPGTGWLLGLHAPAGASFGRFAHALGAPLQEACADIAGAERRLRPHEARLDVAFAPSAALADLCTHPKVRARALALTRWTDAGDDLAPRDLELCADPADPRALSLRARDGGTAGTVATVVPSPLARVRSATAPAGVNRLLLGWSLQRQQAPWAFSPGPLADLDFIPRLLLDGFVIAPASWRLPPEIRSLGRAALTRWRRGARVPRFVQVGEGDQLYPVDLSAPGALADLADYQRVFEIWPPLDVTVDRDGRRIEVVVAVVDDAPPPTETSAVGRVPPPRQAPPLAGWRTFKLYGAQTRQDEILARAIAPAIRDGQRTHEIDAWFFQRYVDGPGRRPHLRLRVHGSGPALPFESRLLAALPPLRADGALTAVEIGEYYPERGRFAEAELPALHAIFQSDSETAAALIAFDVSDPTLLLVEAFDALASGMGLDLAQRHALARARRSAAELSTGPQDEDRLQADADFRRHGHALRAALSGTGAGAARSDTGAGAVLADHRARVAAAARGLPPAARTRLLPTLLHLCAVRLAGPDPDAERLAYTFWERTLEGLRKR
jgi:thiopeptide-type bacteriocin biosynthesis protein